MQSLSVYMKQKCDNLCFFSLINKKTTVFSESKGACKIFIEKKYIFSWQGLLIIEKIMQKCGSFSMIKNLSVRAGFFSPKESKSKTKLKEIVWYTRGQTRCLDVPFCFQSLRV